MELEAELLSLTRGEAEPGPEDAIQEKIDALITPLLAERQELVARRASLNQARERVDGAIAAADKVLRAAGHDPSAKPKRQARRAAPGKLNETALRVISIVAESGEPMTVKDVRDALAQTDDPVADSQVQKYLKEGRDRGILAHAGMRRPESGGRESILYAAFEDTAERLSAAT